eukprot:2199035-Prymnesium_polylepis.1
MSLTMLRSVAEPSSARPSSSTVDLQESVGSTFASVCRVRAAPTHQNTHGIAHACASDGAEGV